MNQTATPPAARVVLVHGIGSHPRPDRTRANWIAALARGMELAGHTDLAEILHAGERVDVKLAHYSSLYRPSGAQGPGGNVPDDAEAALLRQLVAELVDRIHDEPTTAADQQVLDAVRAQLQFAGTPQGLGQASRVVLNAVTTLFDLGPLRRAGRWTSAAIMAGDLRQVTRYLRRGEPDSDGATLDQRIRARVTDMLGPEVVAVLSHSLGSVVAYEALHEHGQPIPLLVTFGSPLGMRTVVLPHLRPQPPTTPSGLNRWINIWDKDDVIVARPHLRRYISVNRQRIGPCSRRVDSDGLWVHPATAYLAHPDLAGPVAEVLRSRLELRTGSNLATPTSPTLKR
jgi:hypothetical protein